MYAGKYDAARMAFERASKLKPSSRVTYNLGLAELQTGRFVDAARHIAEHVRQTPQPTREEREALAKAERYVAHLVLRANVDGARVYVDDEPLGRTPVVIQPVYVLAGRRKIRATLEGFAELTRGLRPRGRQTHGGQSCLWSRFRPRWQVEPVPGPHPKMRERHPPRCSLAPRPRAPLLPPTHRLAAPRHERLSLPPNRSSVQRRSRLAWCMRSKRARRTMRPARQRTRWNWPTGARHAPRRGQRRQAAPRWQTDEATGTETEPSL